MGFPFNKGYFNLNNSTKLYIHFSGMEILHIHKTKIMDLKTKYDDLAGGEANKGKKAGVESTNTKSENANVGTGPSPDINNGGVEGAPTQPKEHTGKLTEMGGGTGGTSGLPDASEGNDNTGGHE